MISLSTKPQFDTQPSKQEKDFQSEVRSNVKKLLLVLSFTFFLITFQRNSPLTQRKNLNLF